MPQLKLTYFAFPGRAEPTRLALALGGIVFEDNTIEFSTWPEMKARVAPLALPQLEIDGTVVSQSLAISRYVGKLVKVDGKPLYPEDPYQGLLVDEILDKITDFWTPFGPTFMIPDEKERAAARSALLAEGGDAEKWAANIDRTLAQSPSGFAVGDSLTIADLFIFTNLNGVQNGFMDGVPLDCLDHLPSVVKHQAKLADHPHISKHYRAKEGPIYGPFRPRNPPSKN